MDRENVIKGLDCCLSFDSPCGGCPYYSYDNIQELECERNLRHDAIELLKEQEEIKERFIEAFNTIRDAYNAPANREKILLNYLARNACCCEQKLLIDSDAITQRWR